MAQYLVLCHDPKPAKDRFGLMEKAAKKDLYNREISNAVLDGGSPTVDGKKISPAGVQPLQDDTGISVSDYTILEATDDDEAIEMARNAPTLREGGTAEVYKIAT